MVLGTGSAYPWLGRAAHKVLLMFYGSQGKYFNVLTSTSSSGVNEAEHSNKSLDFQSRTNFSSFSAEFPV